MEGEGGGGGGGGPSGEGLCKGGRQEVPRNERI